MLVPTTCINSWIKAKECCPMKCSEFKIKRADINARKLLNVVILHCHNYPDCSYTANYWELFVHEEKCPFQKIKCPNKPCKFYAKFTELKEHLGKCEFSRIECGFCYTLIARKEFENHLLNHQSKKTYYIKNCSFCGSSENIRRCLCKKCMCLPCIEEGGSEGQHKDCYVFSTGLNTTSKVYNISKFPLPRNFEVKILFQSVGWIRTGITFNKNIAEYEDDANCPSCDIYCILEDLKQFYTNKNKWRYLFKNKENTLQAGDIMVMRFKNGELRYSVNGIDLGNVVKINLVNKGDFYLFIQCRTEKSKAKIEYITEIFN